VALRAPGFVASNSLVERQTKLVRQGCEPGKNVTELMELIFVRSLPNAPGQLSQLFG
jgi:hypothetical protein